MNVLDAATRIADLIAEHIPDWQAEGDHQSQLYQDPGAGAEWLKCRIQGVVLEVLQDPPAAEER